MTNTISVEQVRKLIEDYRNSERVCMESGSGPVASGQASVWRMVIGSLEALLPRKTMADIDPDWWSGHVGTWVEYQGKNNIIVSYTEDPPVFNLFDPKRNFPHQAPPHELFPLDHSRAWDSGGNPA